MSAATIDDLLPPVLPAAYRAAYALTRNSADAGDVVQEAALNACRAFHTFEQGTNFRAWFLRIVTNVFLLQCRRERRSGRPFSIEAVTEEDGAEPGWLSTDESADPLERTVARIDREVILDALDSLQIEYRTVAVLYFVEDLPYEEIARICEVPVGTVRSRLHRARRLLKARLTGLAADRGLAAATATPAAPARPEAGRYSRRPSAARVA